MSNKEIIDETNEVLTSPKDYGFVFLKGMAMGAADVVPGVSGGTIAFITGIYQRLLNGFKSINPTAVKVLLKDGIAAAWKHIDGSFLLALFAGIFVSLFSLSKALKWCLATYPQMLWAFFFGLIIASTIYVARQVPKWNPMAVIGLVLGAVIAYTITILAPTEATTAYWMVFLSGSIAICAMILPGISGSFILLLMGMYGHVLNAATEMNIVFLLIFMSGCIVGLLLFSHVLSWTFKNYNNTTLAVLTGFMVGSLNKVWPWQNVKEFRVNSHGEQVPFLMENVSPSNYAGGESYVLYCAILFVMGFAMVFLLERLGSARK